MMVSTHLWLGGVVQLLHDCSLADQMPVASSPMRDLLTTSIGNHRQLERLSRLHLAHIPREGQADTGNWSSALTDLTRTAHWYGNQANPEKADGSDHLQDGPWFALASRAIMAGFARRHHPQYGYYSSLEWDLPGTAGLLDIQIPSCCPSSASA